MLLELLVVISIIALMLSVLMPAMKRTRKRTNAVTCRNNLMRWGNFFAMYSFDNDGYFSSGCLTESQDDETTVWYEDHGWVVTLRPYYGNRKILCCPDAVDPTSARRVRGDLCPAVSRAWQVRSRNNTFVSGSYGINSWVYNRNDGGKDGWREQYRWKRLEARAKGADQIPILLDACRLEGYPLEQDCPPEYCCDLGGPVNDIKRFCVPRHNTATHGLFFDNSVRNIGLKQLWGLKWHRKYNIHAPVPAEFSDPAHWMYTLKDY